MYAPVTDRRTPVPAWRDERRESDRHGTDVMMTLAAMPPGHPGRACLRAHAIEMHLPLAWRLANRFHGGGEPIDDLRQVAAIGLIKAVDGFRPDRGHVFIAYAVPTIVGELKRHFRDRVADVRTPRPLQDLCLRVRHATDDLTQRLGRTPRTADIAAYLDSPEEQVIEALACGAGRRTLSLNALDACGGELADRVGADDPRLDRADTRLVVGPLLAALPQRERRIVWLRFYRDQSQSEIAAQLGISQMHVSRLLAGILQELRHGLRGRGPLPGREPAPPGKETRPWPSC